MKLIICFSAFFIAVIMAANQKTAEEYLKEGSEQFTIQLFNEARRQHPDKSIIISAFSVLSPLAQLALASVGQAHDEILRVIGLPNDNVTKEAFSGVTNKLRSVKGVTLDLANRIYIGKNYEINTEFGKVSRDLFESEVQNVDFGDAEKSVAEINSWVAEKTHNKIPDLLDPTAVEANTVSILVNAIYFKGQWKNKFNAALTQEKDFYVTKDKTVKVQMMYRNGDYRYGESKELNAKLLELPYEGDEASLLIVLPNEIDGLSALEDKLKDPSLLRAAQTNMYSMEVDVYLPKWKTETETDLKEALINMDVKTMFSERAQFNNLLKDTRGLYVSKALQKAFIEVNEEGAEAAAANAFIISLTSALIGPTFEANHGFLYFLKERNNVLFSGRFNH